MKKINLVKDGLLSIIFGLIMTVPFGIVMNAGFFMIAFFTILAMILVFFIIKVFDNILLNLIKKEQQKSLNDPLKMVHRSTEHRTVIVQ